MQHWVTARRAFDAGHHVDDHSICPWPGHGHRWEIAVTVTGGLDPKKVEVIDHGSLLHSLDRVVDEISGRNLNDMLPGVVATPEGLALYVRERLILEWPRIIRIVVSMGDNVTVGIETEIR